MNIDQKSEAPATECACRKALEEIAARRCEKVRFDEDGSVRIGEKAYCDPCKARAALATPCCCVGLKNEVLNGKELLAGKALTIQQLWAEADQLRAELAAANERAERAEAQRDVAIKGMSDLESECEFHATDRARLHAWFELQFGESLRGRDFPAKCSMASRVIEDECNAARTELKHAMEVLRVCVKWMKTLHLGEGRAKEYEALTGDQRYAERLVARFDAQGGRWEVKVEYDPKCVELARWFLDDARIYDEGFVTELAGVIQLAIEGWLKGQGAGAVGWKA